MDSDPANPLRIVSWNMWCYNKRPDEAFSFIGSLYADIICLQEVPPVFFKRLQTLPYYAASVIDTKWRPDGTFRATKEEDLNVILSRFPFEEVTAIPLEVSASLTFRSRLFRLFLTTIGDSRSVVPAVRELLSARVSINGVPVQIFSLHTPSTSVAARTRDFEILYTHLNPNTPAIACGDFNIFESWFIKPWNWLNGGRLREAFPWFSERRIREKEFAHAGLINPLRGRITHSIAQSQLDHILVPKDAEILSTKVFPTHGSDHAPVEVTVNI